MRRMRWMALWVALCLLVGALPAALAEAEIVPGDAPELIGVETDQAEAGVSEVGDFEIDAPEPDEAFDLAANAAPAANAGGIALNATNFPDASFRSYLSTQCDEDGDGVLSDEEVEWNAQYLSVDNLMITSLKGIELFPELRALYCYGNLLTSLDLSKNPKLETLNCSENQLTSLDVSKNPNLNGLYCGENQLTSLDVSKNPKLEELDCGQNQLTSLNVSGNPNLQHLSCNENRLQTLNVSNLSKLTHLSCGGNQLKALDVSALSQLEDLDCWNNQLTSLNVSGNAQLAALDCSSNALKALDISKNTKLARLYCGWNPLASLNLSKNTAMVMLDCYGNPLATLDLSAFLPSVKSLFTQANIKAEDDNWTIGTSNYFVRCSKFTEVTMDGKVLHPMEVEIHIAKEVVHPDGDKVSYWWSMQQMGVKEKWTVPVIVNPASEKSKVTFTSSKPKVATVNKKTGKITAKKTGTTTITAKHASGQTAKIKVTVKAAPKKVTLNKKGTVKLKVGKTLSLIAKLPSKTGSVLTWSSSNKSVAGVTMWGEVFALKKGTATITVKTFNGKKASVKVKVS